MARQHFLRGGVPDEGWGARKLLREYVTGEVLHCESPPGFSPPPRVGTDQGSAVANGTLQTSEVVATSSASAVVEGASNPALVTEDSDSDFSDLETFLNETRGSQEKGVTKRKARQLNKRGQKGGAVLVKESPPL